MELFQRWEMHYKTTWSVLSSLFELPLDVLNVELWSVVMNVLPPQVPDHGIPQETELLVMTNRQLHVGDEVLRKEAIHVGDEGVHGVLANSQSYSRSLSCN